MTEEKYSILEEDIFIHTGLFIYELKYTKFYFHLSAKSWFERKINEPTDKYIDSFSEIFDRISDSNPIKTELLFYLNDLMHLGK